ncbi:MAG: ribonuclease H-like domain-containing protein [Gloeobacteraceae cyanobacterium ES-bin-316]|nr:ribonuclease H-like domain-containing protein [Ferruginibacter sp.]
MILKDIRSSKNGIFIKHEDNSWSPVKYPWYFYVRLSQFELVPSRYYDSYSLGKAYVKLYCDNFKARQSTLQELYAKGIETFEGDLKPEERYKYDHEIEISKDQDILYFDIETDDRQRKIEIGRDYILSWVAWDNKGNKFKVELGFLDYDSEHNLINKFYLLCKNYDIIAGWNIKKFDVPYFRKRGEIYGLRFPNVGQYDLFQRTKHIYRFDSTIKSFSLESISQLFLGEGKIKHPGTYKLWEQKDGSLLKYNEHDVDLTKRIDEKLKISEMMILQSSWCKSLPRKFSLYSLIDSVIIQQSHKILRPVPTNYRALVTYDETRVDDEEFEKYLGAEVLDPEIGYRENVTVFDFKSLYPSIMLTLNIGYDTLNYSEGIKCPGTSVVARGETKLLQPTFFRKDPSCIAETIRTLIGLRNEYKNLKLEYIEKGWTDKPEYQKVVSDEIIVKELSNSVYGIMGMQFGRYYNVDVAESITLTGRWILQFAKKTFIEMGYSVIYGDTDSIFVHSEDALDVDKCLDHFHREIVNELQRNFFVDKSHISLNFDKHYVTFALFAKKNYVGLADNMEGKVTDKIYVRGMEYIKRNAFKFAAEKQKELIENILRKKLPLCDVLQEIRKYKAEFFNRKFTKEELELSVRINKREYTGNSISAFLSKQITDETGTNPEGTEVKYIITDCKRRLIGIQSEKYNGKFSRLYYWENATRPMLNKVLQLVDPGKDIDQDLLF